MKFTIGRGLNLLPILLAPFLLLSPIFLSGRALFWGTPLLQFVPWWEYAWRTVLAGHLPLWNPMVGMGAPLLANYQSALVYPPTWLYFILYLLGGLKLMAWGQALLIAFHLAWAGLGMSSLMRRLGFGALAQVVAGLAFGLSSYLAARSWFFSINSAVAWLPWVLWCLAPDYRQREINLLSGKRFSLLVFCLAMQLLAGHAQITWYTLLLTVPWVSFWTLSDRSASNISGRISRLARQLLPLLLAVFLASGIAAVQLLPTAEYLLHSQRSNSVDYQVALTYSFWPWRLLTLFAPTFFGSPVNGDYWGYGNFWEDSIYIGLLPILLAIGAVLGFIFGRKWFRKSTPESNEKPQPIYDLPGDTTRRCLIPFLFILIFFALVMAFGDNTPIFPWLFNHVPTFNMFQAPTRWMVWGVFSLSILSGIGAEKWRRPNGWYLYWTRLGTMGAIAVSLGAGLAWYKLGDVSPSFIRSTAILGFLGLGAGILSLTAPPRDPEIVHDIHTNIDLNQDGANSPHIPTGFWRKYFFHFKPPLPTGRSLEKPYPLNIWQWAVAVFIVVDLLAMNWGLIPAGDLNLYGPSPTALEIKALSNGGRLFISNKSEYWLKFIRFLRFDTFDPGEDWENFRATLLSNSNMLDDIASVSNFDPLTPGRFADWNEMLDEASPEVNHRMLQMMNVGVVETLSDDEPYGIRFDREVGRWFYWVECATVARDALEARKSIIDGRIDFNKEVLLEGISEIPASDCGSKESGIAKSGSHSLEILNADNPNRIDLHVTTDSPAWLVLSEVWYPGWEARLDDKEISILRANYLFRAVRIPNGDHELSFIYKPLSFWSGLTITFLSSLAMLFVVRKRNSV